MTRLRGAQTEHDGFGSMRVVDQFQGVPAAAGVNTVLPIRLSHRPRAAEGVALFAGEAPVGAGELQRQGVDYSVDIENRRITWLATARKPLSVGAVIIVRYWRRRKFDPVMEALGLE